VPGCARKPVTIGLTGGIGSGKSTVARCWAQLGATVIDTDALARELTLAQGAAMPAIKAEFGASVIAADGSLDRAAMRELAFADPGVRKRLEAILHPMIGARTTELATASRADLIVFDVPLLVESGRWRERVDHVLVVDCEESTQIERVMKRSGWTREAVEAVMRQQATREQRRGVADAVIYNEHCSIEDLQQQVKELVRQWCGADFDAQSCGTSTRL